jgi:hypothetical protein
MNVKVKVSDLNHAQFGALDEILRTEYQFPEDGTRVFVQFQLTSMFERHAEMPAGELHQVLYLLEVIGRGGQLHKHGDVLCAVQPSQEIAGGVFPRPPREIRKG